MPSKKIMPAALGILMCVWAGVAVAQQSAAPAAPDPASVKVDPPSCEEPPHSPPLGMDPRQADRFNKQVRAYQNCMQAYIKNTQDQAIRYDTVSKMYLDAASGAVSKYNTYIADLNEVLKSRGVDQPETSTGK